MDAVQPTKVIYSFGCESRECAAAKLAEVRRILKGGGK